jgi:asparagine synthase (glutamine-hydrolysing)
MCGFAGYFKGINYGDELLHKMGNALLHRGPDDSGVWFDKSEQIGFAHQRLAVIDCSPAGKQPMVSSSERYVLVFNGEIYNHLKLRLKLKSKNFKGHSDTETLLALIEEFGLEKSLKSTEGMFALALWDKRKKELYLARDRIGEKPLYYGWQGEGSGASFLFGSELKSIKQHPSFVPEINRDAIALLLRHNYIPAPYSIYQGVSKLEPGCMLKISHEIPKPKIYAYWSAIFEINSGVAHPFTGSANDAINKLEELSMEAVGQQMVSDVPLGAFLSGGVDSSLVVALMQAQSEKPIKSFSIGFNEKAYNEAGYAKKVANHLGTDHTELYVSSESAMNVIPKLPELYCEPFSDSSQIPTFLVSQLAKEHVTVSLSGDGGDELFCGYNRYHLANNLWSKISILPIPIRASIANAITSFSPESWNKLSKFIPTSGRFNHIGDKLHKGADALNSKTIDELYLNLVSHFDTPESIVIGGCEPLTHLTSNAHDFSELSDIQRMMALDLITYLPDDILVKVDRAAMAVSLETRVPFLSHKIVEFAWTLPQSYKLRDGKTKWPLRQILYRHVPQKLIERPKMGFGIPIDSWLRGPLRVWAEGLLDESRLQREGFFHVEPIRRKWEEHLSGKRNWQYHIWTILMFQSWLEANHG